MRRIELMAMSGLRGLPDQSLLFWLSILPLLGIPLIVVGSVFVYRSARRSS